MNQNIKIDEALSSLDPDLARLIKSEAIVQDFPKDMEILRHGQYIKVIPIVIEGLIKVLTQFEDKELLLYYIQPQESCIMSFAASLKNEPSPVSAIVEENTTALLLPVDKVSKWTKQFPDLNGLFFQQYNLRYSELLNTIQHLLFSKLDQRIYDYLKKKCEMKSSGLLKISHRQIAEELGTAREVVSRILKKLESDKRLEQTQDGIRILE